MSVKTDFCGGGASIRFVVGYCRYYLPTSLVSSPGPSWYLQYLQRWTLPLFSALAGEGCSLPAAEIDSVGSSSR